MSFHVLSPEVPANAYNEVFAEDPRVSRRTISASLQFEYPLENELITSIRTYAVTEELAAAMTAAGLTGFGLSDVIETTIADWVEEPNRIGVIPPLRVLDIGGLPLHDDLGLRAKDGQLIVSQRAYDLITNLDPRLGVSSRLVDEQGNTILPF